MARTFEGEGVLVASAGLNKALRKHGLRQRLISPANAFTGRPTFPLAKARLGREVSAVSLSGGISLVSGNGRKVRISGLKLVLRSGSSPVVRARVAGTRMRLFRVKGAKIERDLKSGVLNLRSGFALLSGPASKTIAGFAGPRAVKRFSKGSRWGQISVFAARNNKIKDPAAEPPVEPPYLERPVGAADVASASINWRVRESFIRYVAVGAGTSVADGATAGAPEAIGGAAPLVYAFNFPFADGWAAADPGPAAIHGNGKVGFRQCLHTINFTVADPEIELNGDADSRLIFRVNGTDGTAFPNSRAVMVQLIPSLASRTTVGNTTTLSGIPGYIPEAATGIFADFYPPFPGSVDDPSAELSRFGSVTVSYTTG